MADIKVRLEPADEYTHAVEAAANFNESVYINCFDPEQGVGGWFRMGNRANEGQAEMTACLYLPAEASEVAADGDAQARQVGFMYKRPKIDNNDAFDAAGMTWTMITPFEALEP